MASFKMRVLYYSKSGKIAAMAGAIASKYDVKLDDIPPAYPCDNEKLVLLGVSAKKEIPDKVRQFCAELNPQRAQNVALFFDGPEDLATEVIDLAKAAGARVVGETFFVVGGIPFFKGISPEEKSATEMWAYKMLSLAK